jgi:hypothetical protein
MVLGKKSVQVSELFVVHGYRASAAFPRIYRNLLIPRQLSTRLVTFRGRTRMVVGASGAADIGGMRLPVNHLLTMPA